MSVLTAHESTILNAKKQFDGIASILYTLNSQISFIHSTEQIHMLASTHNLTDIPHAVANASSYIAPIRSSIIAVDRIIDYNSADFPVNVPTSLSAIVKFVTYIEDAMNNMKVAYSSMVPLIANLTTSKELFSTHLDTYSKAVVLRADGSKIMNQMGDDYTKASTEYSKVMETFLYMHEAEKAEAAKLAKEAEATSDENVEVIIPSSPNVVADLIDVAASATAAEQQSDIHTISSQIGAVAEGTVVYDAAPSEIINDEATNMENSIIVEQQEVN